MCLVDVNRIKARSRNVEFVGRMIGGTLVTGKAQNISGDDVELNEVESRLCSFYAANPG